MLYLRLANTNGIAEICDAEDCSIEDDDLVMRAADGHVVARFLRLDVLAFSPRRDRLEQSDGSAPPPINP
jgi:hypothetical protein